MARFLTTIPSNLGFFNLGTVESYPTGGGGPTAYGPTSYFGSDPLPAEQGDNLNNPINLGDFSSIFKSTLMLVSFVFLLILPLRFIIKNRYTYIIQLWQ